MVTKTNEWIGSVNYDKAIEAALKVGDMRTNYTPAFLSKDASKAEVKQEEMRAENYRQIVGNAVIDFASQDGYDLDVNAEEAYEIAMAWKDFD